MKSLGEGETLDSVLGGWATQAIEDLVLLERGMQLIEWPVSQHAIDLPRSSVDEP